MLCSMQKVLTRLLILSSLALLAPLSACVQAPPVLAAAGSCSKLVPEDWYKKGVSSAELPGEDKIGPWMGFGVAQTGQLDKANSQTADTYNIVSRCEARDAAIIEAMKPKPWWKVW